MASEKDSKMEEQKKPASENNDRLMSMMDKKLGKFEAMITQIATNMGQLRGEVNTIKGKLEKAEM